MNRCTQFILLVGFMILYVILGTLLHESGHIVIARILGYHSTLHYASMDWYQPNGIKGTNRNDSFYITLGGVCILDLISIISICLLYFKGDVLPKWAFWIEVFFSMMIFRHILLSLTGLALSLSQGRPISYGRDETEIANYLNISNHLIGIPLLLIALISCCVLFFVVLDKGIRSKLLFATCIGGLIGYVVWLSYLGPLIMP